MGEGQTIREVHIMGEGGCQVGKLGVLLLR